MISATDNLGVLLHDSTRLLRRRLDKRISHLGLSTAQWRLLVGALRSGGMTQARIAEKLEIEPISVSRLVDRMEQAGWVERVPDPTDRRAKMVVPTDRAQSFYETIRDAAREVTAEALAGLDDERKLVLIETLQHVVTNLAADEPLCSVPGTVNGTPR